MKSPYKLPKLLAEDGAYEQCLLNNARVAVSTGTLDYT